MLGWLARRIGMARLVALLLVGFAIFVRVADPFPVQIIRNLTFDIFHQIKPRAPRDAPVAIIDVDDASIAEIGQWPWPRTRFADLVDAAMADGAVALAFDIIFAEPDRLSPAQIARDNQQLSPVMMEALTSLPDNDARLARSFARARTAQDDLAHGVAFEHHHVGAARQLP